MIKTLRRLQHWFERQSDQMYRTAAHMRELRSLQEHLPVTRPESMSYMAHPVAPYTIDHENGTELVTIDCNLENARKWLKALQLAFPATVIVAPWIPAVEVFDDNDPELRAIGLTRDCYVAGRCDRIVLVGGRISRGMILERDHMLSIALPVFDLTHLGRTPPTLMQLRASLRL